MSMPKELDDFRRQWKEEVLQKQKPTPSHEVPDIANSSDSTAKYGGDSKDNIAKKLKIVHENLLGKRALLDTPLSSSESSNKKQKLQQNDATDNISQQTNSKKERLLDIFLADLDEINEIPFFDLEIPREIAMKIFHHLDMKDLCHCAQVSKAWRSLAEDELLWCNICKQLGYEQTSDTTDNENWKDIVKEAVQMEDMLTYNWKNGIGNMEELSYIPGGVLTAVSSFQDWVLAGYTSLEAKLWNLETESECILSPSTTALVPQEEGSFIQNSITGVAGNDKYSAAIFKTGMVDVWDNNSKHTSPVYTCHGISLATTMSLKCSPHTPTIAVSYGGYVRVDSLRESEWGEGEAMAWGMVEQVRYGEEKINDFLLLPNPKSNDKNHEVLAVAIDDQVKIHPVSHRYDDMTQLYHTAFAPVHLLDSRGDELAMVVNQNQGLQGFHMLSADIGYQVQIYSLEKCQEITKLPLQEWKITVMNIRDSPQNMVVTGGYRSVGLFDTRVCTKVLSLTTNSDTVTRVQADDWKVVVGGRDGFVCVWDQRMTHTKLWDMHNRHPVGYLHFKKNILIAANIPSTQAVSEMMEQEDKMLHRRYQGRLYVKDFSVSQQRGDLPSICQSTFDEPERYNYNVRLTVPYDNL